MIKDCTFPALALTVALAFAGPAFAQTVTSPEGVTEPAPTAQGKSSRPNAANAERVGEQERKKARLDVLFGRLAGADSKRQADRIGRHIMRRMGQSGSPTIDILMEQASVLMRRKSYGPALDLLDGVVRLRPEFAEGWNRRATVHYLRGDYASSLVDIAEVLRREPRHWGALSGLSMILVATDRKSEAAEVMDRALSVHPHLERMKERREQLRLELRGQAI